MDNILPTGDNIKEHLSIYVKELDRLYQTGKTTEHSFRPALQRLLEQMCACTVVNEQTHIDCGAPDLTLFKKNLPIAFVEAKNLEDGDLDGHKKNKEQFDRYKSSLDTIVFTDYLDFRLYKQGEWVMSVRLAEIQGNHIRLSDAPRFVEMIEIIKVQVPQRITSADKLAQLMASKARLLRDIIEQAITNDQQQGKTTYESELLGYMLSFQDVLLHDITPKTFADIYAQTIAYGMFAARLHDNTPEDFSRAEAANLIPKTNPFLRKVFQQIAGYDLDDRIAWIVDDLVAAFAATDVEKVMQGFGKSTQMTDPLMHFYEDFLFQYDPAAKKQCGVYYTPQPVVNYIVRAVDDILKTEFDLPLGLADTSRVNHKDRVQVLDPAVGTGTFLAEVVRQIKRNLASQIGGWNAYVTEHLLPRLHGFELMMAPYTIAHLKLDMEIGVPAQDRLKVYLTNSLEEFNQDAGTLFGNVLSQEANAASTIKKDAPIMVMIGNPPYSVSSNNKGEWISNLLNDYKKDLNERNIQPLSDDYIKFIRLGQHYVERNNEGVLAYISNNSFIDGLIHRQMRKELMRCFDKIYIIDLHGNARKKETALDGSKDENVFDIMQGVSINIFVKNGKQDKKPAEVYHYDLYGSRQSKYDFLAENSLSSTPWTKLEPTEPQYFFVPKNFGEETINNSFRLNDLLKFFKTGIETRRDSIVIQQKESEARKMVADFTTKEKGELLRLYPDATDSRDWQLESAIKDLSTHQVPIQKIAYRPFDLRYTPYTGQCRGIMGYAFIEVMKHMLRGDNLALIAVRGFPTPEESAVGFTVDKLCVKRSWTRPGIGSGDCVFPLYLYPEQGSIDTERRPNLDEKIWAEINTKAGRETSPEEIFDYIYGVLHSPHYRETYKEFLKVDFPRVPYPNDAKEFDHYAYYGHQLRELHLMHSCPNMPDIATFPIEGDCVVEQLKWEQGRVIINSTQYFDNVPATAWNFYIGGYQPAQKWLKDRKGRTLTFDDIAHYTKIIRILIETDRLMREIDQPPFRSKPLAHPTSGETQPTTIIHYHVDHLDIHNSDVKIEHLD